MINQQQKYLTAFNKAIISWYCVKTSKCKAYTRSSHYKKPFCLPIEETQIKIHDYNYYFHRSSLVHFNNIFERTLPLDSCC